MQLVNVQVAFKRIGEFLRSEEQGPLEVQQSVTQNEPTVSIQGSYTWSVDEAPFFTDLNLKVNQGQLVAVVGSTGSGKSSLLNVILGLLSKVEGEPLSVLGRIAYVPQNPFIFNATVKENILFGKEYEEQAYINAVASAALATDFQQFAAGDETELGEKGINISGGQKQRISLARAIYSDAEVYLLDDPLSALDAKVAQQVFRTCIKGHLAQKTRILVTNLLQFAVSADVIVYMQEGKIAEIGSYKQLMDKKGGFAQLMSEATIEEEEEDDKTNGQMQGGKDNNETDKSSLANAVVATQIKKTSKKNADSAGQLTVTEERSTGVVSRQVIGAWVKAMGGAAPFLVLIFLYVLSEFFRAASTIWLSFWTDWSSDPNGTHGPFFYLDIYATISLVQVLSTFINELDLRTLSIRASRVLHDGMLNSLLRAPMAFFHTTPSGRIINRLSKDTSDVDRNLAFFASFFFRAFLQLLTTVILVGVITPFTLPILVPVMLIFYFLYTFFQTSVREVKRLDSVSRSPVYTSIGEAISGLSTIRAFGAEERLLQHNSGLLDANVVMSLVNQSMNRWLGVRLETLGALVALSTAVLSIEQKNSASQFGLSLSYALQITSFTNIVIRLASLAENSFNAVERIDEYSKLDPEADLQKPDSTPEGWPCAGKVKFEDVKMRYRPGLPLVLKGLSVQFDAGMKCGVVGRTGAGKSSLINSLFRLAELDSGSIMIDDLDTSKIGLHQLRGAMSIIPQSPTIFTGSVRFNLSPFGEHSDDQIWLALQRAYLSPVIQTHPEGLDLILQEGGSPLSAGQKQLLALARALLRGSKILVLDEATANVDVETDALIQKTIRTEFQDCTIVAIAHRLHTIIDCDCILVMDQGQTAEFGSPAVLLNNPQGVFSSMVHETGEATEKFLRSIAFGEVNLDQEYAEEAEKALTKIQKAQPIFEDCSGSALYLVEKAKVTLKILHNLMENLKFVGTAHSAEIALINEAMGVSRRAKDPEKFSNAAQALKEATALVDDIAHLAECTQSFFMSQGLELEGFGSSEGKRYSVSDQEWAASIQQTMQTSNRWGRVRLAVNSGSLRSFSSSRGRSES